MTIIGTVLSISDNPKGITILIDTTKDGQENHLQLTTTRHEDLQEIKRGSTLKIEISNDNQ